jgi:molybdopterin-biosynthesis enzyme MoeA-like protein
MDTSVANAPCGLFWQVTKCRQFRLIGIPKEFTSAAESLIEDRIFAVMSRTKPGGAFTEQMVSRWTQSAGPGWVPIAKRATELIS